MDNADSGGDSGTATPAAAALEAAVVVAERDDECLIELAGGDLVGWFAARGVRVDAIESADGEARLERDLTERQFAALQRAYLKRLLRVAPPTTGSGPVAICESAAPLAPDCPRVDPSRPPSA